MGRWPGTSPLFLILYRNTYEVEHQKDDKSRNPAQCTYQNGCDIDGNVPHSEDIEEIEYQQKNDTYHGIDDQFGDILQEIPE